MGRPSGRAHAPRGPKLRRLHEGAQGGASPRREGRPTRREGVLRSVVLLAGGCPGGFSNCVETMDPIPRFPCAHAEKLMDVSVRADTRAVIEEELGPQAATVCVVGLG